MDSNSDTPFSCKRGDGTDLDMEPLGKKDGYRWGLAHVEYVKRELLKLEERALVRHDIKLLHEIMASKIRAVDVEEELRKKLADLQQQD